MHDRLTQATLLRTLHQRGIPLVLFNIWDPGSAKAAVEAGVRALATGSASVAAAYGYEDGEKIPWALALDNLRRIARATDLPITVDLESGYGDIASTVRQAVEAGAVGFNFEDSKIGTSELYPTEQQCERIRLARNAADQSLTGVFVNARTDIFLQADKSTHSERMVDEALARCAAYAEAGADGLFVPGLVDRGKIERICKASSLPVNIMARPGEGKRGEFAALGVARISYGPYPYLLAMNALAQAAKEAIAG